MIILSIKTDNPMAEIGLWDGNQNLKTYTWHADRQLTDTIHLKIEDLLKQESLNWHDIQAIAVFKGPGSFTGLRIGASVANALAIGLGVPIIGKSGDDWLDAAITVLQSGKNDQYVTPEYGADAHLTLPKK